MGKIKTRAHLHHTFKHWHKIIHKCVCSSVVRPYFLLVLGLKDHFGRGYIKQMSPNMLKHGVI